MRFIAGRYSDVVTAAVCDKCGKEFQTKQDYVKVDMSSTSIGESKKYFLECPYCGNREQLEVMR